MDNLVRLFIIFGTNAQIWSTTSSGICLLSFVVISGVYFTIEGARAENIPVAFFYKVRVF